MGLDINGVFVISLVFMQIHELFVSNFKLDRKIKKVKNRDRTRKKLCNLNPLAYFEFCTRSSCLLR